MGHDRPWTAIGVGSLSIIGALGTNDVTNVRTLHLRSRDLKRCRIEGVLEPLGSHGPFGTKEMSSKRNLETPRWRFHRFSNI